MKLNLVETGCVVVVVIGIISVFTGKLDPVTAVGLVVLSGAAILIK